MVSKQSIVALLILVFTLACSRKNFDVPSVSDDPVVEAVRLGEIARVVPGYGISVLKDAVLQFEVNIEAEDSSFIRAGQSCVAYVPPSNDPIECFVSKVLGSVSEETGQGIAWLTPKHFAALARGQFIFATITTGIKHHALIVAKRALLNKDAKTWVIRREFQRDGSSRFVPVEIKTGIISERDAEIISGVSVKDEIVVQGGLGYLYPEFKAAAAAASD